MTINRSFGYFIMSILASVLAVACSAGPQLGVDAAAPSASTGGSAGPGGSGGGPGTGGAGGSGNPSGTGGGSGGAIGGGGTAGADAAPPDAGADTGGTAAPDAPGPAGNFTCTLVLGAFQTSQWYDGGFETAVGTERWEIKSAHNLWTERWANLNDSAWNTPTVSPCTTNPTMPDRVLFVVYKNFMVAAPPPAIWEPEITKDVQNIAIKYPSVRQIDLLTLARGPNNQLCPGNSSRNISIAPEIDAAIQSVADKSGGLVKVGPKYYVPDCSMFEPNITTLTPGSGARVAPQLIEYYKAHP